MRGFSYKYKQVLNNERKGHERPRFLNEAVAAPNHGHHTTVACFFRAKMIDGAEVLNG